MVGEMVMSDAKGQKSIGMPASEYGAIRDHIHDLEYLFRSKYLDFIKNAEVETFAEFIRPVQDLCGIWGFEYGDMVMISHKKFLFAQECFEEAYVRLKDVVVNEKYMGSHRDYKTSVYLIELM